MIWVTPKSKWFAIYYFHALLWFQKTGFGKCSSGPPQGHANNHKSEIQNSLGRITLVSETMAFDKPVFLLFSIILDYNESYKVIYY